MSEEERLHCETMMMSKTGGEFKVFSTKAARDVCVCARAGVCLHVCFSVRRDLGPSLNVALSEV